MTKAEFEKRVEVAQNETHDALALVWSALNNGQQKKLLKDAEVVAVLRQYGVIDPWNKADINKVVKEYNAKLPTPPMTNGIPRALAEARQRAYNDRIAESNLTVEVTAGR